MCVAQCLFFFIKERERAQNTHTDSQREKQREKQKRERGVLRRIVNARVILYFRERERERELENSERERSNKQRSNSNNKKKMVAINRTSKMLAFINYRVRVTVVDGRQIVGRFLAFDRHMNLVLADSEEFRKLPSSSSKKKKDEDENGKGGEDVRRVLGFVLLRGEEVISVAVEGPPIRVKKTKPADASAGGGIPGAGVARPAGRGAPPPGMMPSSSGGGPRLGQQQPPPGMMMPPPGFRPGMGPQ